MGGRGPGPWLGLWLGLWPVWMPVLEEPVGAREGTVGCRSLGRCGAGWAHLGLPRTLREPCTARRARARPGEQGAQVTAGIQPMTLALPPPQARPTRVPPGGGTQMVGTQHTGHCLGNAGSGPEDMEEPPVGAAVADCRGFPGLHTGPAPPAPRLPAGCAWGLSGASASPHGAVLQGSRSPGPRALISPRRADLPAPRAPGAQSPPWGDLKTRR